MLGRRMGFRRYRNPLLMVNPTRREQQLIRLGKMPKPTTKKTPKTKVKGSSKSSKKTKKRSYSKSSISAHSVPKTKKRGRPAGKKTSKRRSSKKSTKKRTTKKRTTKKRTTKKRTTKKRTTKKRTTKKRSFTGKGWHDNEVGHRKASRRGWSRRKIGYRKVKGRKYYLKNSKNERYFRPKKTKYSGEKKYRIWRNPFNAQGLFLKVTLASLGFIGAGLLMKGIPPSITSKLKIGEFNVSNIVIPIAAGIGLAYLSTKIDFLKKHVDAVSFLALGLTAAGGILAVKTGLDRSGLSEKLGLSGYVRSVSGYVPAGTLGQFEERVPSRLGAPVQYRGAIAPAGVPSERALGYNPLGVKPYGLGLPREERRYNRFSWQGVYDLGSYE